LLVAGCFLEDKKMSAWQICVDITERVVDSFCERVMACLNAAARALIGPYGSPYGGEITLLGFQNGKLVKLDAVVAGDGTLKVGTAGTLCYVTAVADDHNALYGIRDSRGITVYVPQGTNWMFGATFPQAAIDWLNGLGIGTFTAYMSGSTMKLVSQNAGNAKPVELIYRHSTQSSGNIIGSAAFVKEDCASAIPAVPELEIQHVFTGFTNTRTYEGFELKVVSPNNAISDATVVYAEYRPYSGGAWVSLGEATKKLDYRSICAHGLAPNTEYVVRAYVLQNGSPVYSAEFAVATVMPQTIETQGTSNVSSNQATMSALGHVDTGVARMRFSLHPTSNPAGVLYSDVVFFDGNNQNPGILITTTGLQSNTQYTYTAQLLNPCNMNVIASGAAATFTTPA